jgi:NAD(P)-dependent dehydrogenase (short-subunit alcohol dehydrogenase family)
MSPTERVAIVTGGGRGMGAAVARRLARQGVSVAVLDLDPHAASEAAGRAQEAGVRSVGLACDVRSAQEVGEAVDEVVSQLGRIDVLVNCAGAYSSPRPVHETPEDLWDLTVDSNLKGMFLCIRAVLPHMMEQQGGRIVNFASNAARSTATALGCEYTAAKAGVLGLTRHVAREYAPYDILVNAIAPGPVEGDRLNNLSPGGTAGIAQAIPLGRLGTADEVAEVAVFLTSEAVTFMTGATVDVNGGIVMV